MSRCTSSAEAAVEEAVAASSRTAAAGRRQKKFCHSADDFTTTSSGQGFEFGSVWRRLPDSANSGTGRFCNVLPGPRSSARQFGRTPPQEAYREDRGEDFSRSQGLR